MQHSNDYNFTHFTIMELGILRRDETEISRNANNGSKLFS